MLKVALMRAGKFPIYVPDIVAWEWIGWDDDPDRNAANAIKLAHQVLHRPNVENGHGLGALTGYRWGGDNA